MLRLDEVAFLPLISGVEWIAAVDVVKWLADD